MICDDCKYRNQDESAWPCKNCTPDDRRFEAETDAEMLRRIELARLREQLAGAEAIIAHFGLEGIDEGDVICLNDPYKGGTHINDITFLTLDESSFTKLKNSIDERHHTGGNKAVVEGKQFRYSFDMQTVYGFKYYAVTVAMK